MYRLILFLSLLISFSLKAQIISQFTWNSGPVTKADVGPDAISISSSATSSSGGSLGTNGLNPGAPLADIDMVLPGSPTFDVAGIDISIDYQRDENSADFFTRGSYFNLSAGSHFSVHYRVENGSGGYTTVSSGNVYAIPHDDVFRRYRFVYLPVSGRGILMVNDVEVWSFDGPDNRALYWSGAGNITVGRLMDATGSNQPTIDSLVIGVTSFSPLPIELLSFEAEQMNDQEVELQWETASETQNDYFTVERTVNGLDWIEVGRVNGAGNSNQRLMYSLTDYDLTYGTVYYRLKQTDFNGDFSYSDIRKVNVMADSDMLRVSVYPNPVNTLLTIEGSKKEMTQLGIYNSLGQEITALLEINYINDKEAVINFDYLTPGYYFVKTATATHKIIKQ